ncbi:syntaxin 1A [Clonorchis sinensis]|uniref:Syntaxin 1A n=1 Tax=Clonorchis sinensis TaxID=79923 RepID=G7Y8R6_CLOSI|nr:syntaxin 1A [Clonorchis sinensis]
MSELEQAIHEQEAKDPSLATVRVRRTQHSTITRRFMDVMAAYNKEQTDYRDACKAQIKLKLEIAECPRTDEELEQMLESDNPQIFTQGILMDTQQARQNAADIEARHEDILKLEKSIRELHELFIDLAALVDSQSELLDRIEYNVDATQDHITGAVVATKKAKEYQKKSRKLLHLLFRVQSWANINLHLLTGGIRSLCLSVVPSVNCLLLVLDAHGWIHGQKCDGRSEELLARWSFTDYPAGSFFKGGYVSPRTDPARF